MNYGWPVKRQREKEVCAPSLSSSSWVMEVSRCECCHADGDPGVLQKGGEEKEEGMKKNRELKGKISVKRDGALCFYFLDTSCLDRAGQEVRLIDCRGFTVVFNHRQDHCQLDKTSLGLCVLILITVRVR